MARRPAVPAAARDHWLLAASALETGLLETANGYAGRAVELSGQWERYRWAMQQDGVYVGINPLLPARWGFLLREGWRRLLLVHPAATPFIAVTAGRSFVALVDRLEDGGDGLVRVDEALGELLARAFQVPDDPGDLVTP